MGDGERRFLEDTRRNTVIYSRPKHVRYLGDGAGSANGNFGHHPYRGGAATPLAPRGNIAAHCPNAACQAVICACEGRRKNEPIPFGIGALPRRTMAELASSIVHPSNLLFRHRGDPGNDNRIDASRRRRFRFGSSGKIKSEIHYGLPGVVP